MRYCHMNPWTPASDEDVRVAIRYKDRYEKDLNEEREAAMRSAATARQTATSQRILPAAGTGNANRGGPSRDPVFEIYADIMRDAAIAVEKAKARIKGLRQEQAKYDAIMDAVYGLKPKEKEFLCDALAPAADRSEVMNRYGLSPTSYWRWLNKYTAAAAEECGYEPPKAPRKKKKDGGAEEEGEA